MECILANKRKNMGTKVANHLHRYKKINLGRDGKEYFVYRCMKPSCSHYIRVELAEGKLCECNRCREIMVINKAVLIGSPSRAMTEPHCEKCTKRKKVRDVETIENFLDSYIDRSKTTP